MVECSGIQTPTSSTRSERTQHSSYRYSRKARRRVTTSHASSTTRTKRGFGSPCGDLVDDWPASPPTVVVVLSPYDPLSSSLCKVRMHASKDSPASPSGAVAPYGVVTGKWCVCSRFPCVLHLRRPPPFSNGRAEPRPRVIFAKGRAC